MITCKINTYVITLYYRGLPIIGLANWYGQYQLSFMIIAIGGIIVKNSDMNTYIFINTAQWF